ncbi:MAG: hypothetical protein DRO36_05360 [Candidatus Hecatellales archaeon]|nr:MAG: hypothetical protein DRO36_05360 [Candidatus Hecatellales archaeon]
MSISDIDREIGDIEEFERQYKICEKLGLRIEGPVYRSWEPSTKPKDSKYMKLVSSYSLLKEIINFVNLHDVVTVRQIFYGLVSNQTIENNEHEYDRIVRICKNARLAGLIPFDKIIDDTREAEKTPSWDSIEEIIGAAINQYRSDWWKDQQYYVEVWLEKRTLRRIFYPITNSFDVHLCIGGGYQSWSEIWEAVKRFESRENQEIVILYFGDLDPSGKDIPRDLRERFSDLKVPVTVKEIALTRDDIEQYNLPRNPSKTREGKQKGDPRKDWYFQKYGIDYGVELDALPPDVLRNKLEEAIIDHISDPHRFRQRIEQDKEEKTYWQKILAS